MRLLLASLLLAQVVCWCSAARPEPINGTAAADLLEGTSGPDVIYGGPGADLIDAGAQNDEVNGEGDDDTIYAGAGDDTVLGGPGDDFLRGSLGADTLDGGAGDDKMYGDYGDDTLIATEGVDTVVGGAGEDRVILCTPGTARDAVTTPADISEVEHIDYVDCGAGLGDPHFLGFDQSRFDYAGRPGQAFNLISTRATLVNALLAPDLVQGLTYMANLGVRVGGDRLRLVALEGRLLVEINDVVMEGEDDGGLSLSGLSLPGGLRLERVAPGRVAVTTPECLLKVAVHKEQFLDITEAAMLRTPSDIHGVLGQTARPDHANFHGYFGEEADYFVSSLWSDDFKFGRRFSGAGDPRRSVGGPRGVAAAVLNVQAM